MRRDEKITYIDLVTNRSATLELEQGRNPYWLRQVDGLDGLDNDIYTTKGSGQDGVTETGSNLQERVVTVMGSLHFDKEASRRNLLRVLNPRNPARLIYSNRDGTWYLNGRIRTAPRFVAEVLPAWQFDFYAPFPFWRVGDGTSGQLISIAYWVPNLEWTPFIEIPEEQEMEIEYRAPALIANAVNTGDVETGMMIEFRATGTTANPSLINVVTRETFAIDINMIPGDVIRVWTGYGEKRAILYRGLEETNIFNRIARGSTWLKLHVGDNPIRYDADVIENIEVDMHIETALLGV